MQIRHYTYNVRALVYLGAEDLYHVIGQALRHYDLKCRDAARQGGFLCGFRNSLARTENQHGAEYFLSFSQLDLLNKILEGSDRAELRESVLKSLHTLRDEELRVGHIMQAVRAKHRLPVEFPWLEPDHRETRPFELSREDLRIARQHDDDSVASGILAMYMDELKSGAERVTRHLELWEAERLRACLMPAKHALPAAYDRLSDLIEELHVMDSVRG